ncbi:uncharacterized protein LOC134832123 [Culicoides brevitarsis]|uniref:uncharacterized protein LOC134832123 n=1 Tax=Culicoides brevitarsis TaxID=469753 RepID=UPI00307C6204
MRYISYIICLIIVFICWLSNADARKIQEENIIKTAFVSGMKRLKRAIFSVDRYLTDTLPGLQQQEQEEEIPDQEEYPPMKKFKRAGVRKTGRRGSLLPMVVQRKNPLGKKAPPKKVLQKLNAVASAPATFNLPVKRPAAVSNKKPLATGPPKKTR